MSLIKIALLLFVLVCGSQAANWNCTTTGDFSNPACWDTGVVPTAQEDANIGSGVATISAAVNVDRIYVSSGALLEISSTLTTYYLQNSGEVSVLAAGMVSGTNSSAQYYDNSYQAVMNITGTFEILVEIQYGIVYVFGGAQVSSILNSNELWIASGAKITNLESDSNIAFGETADGEIIELESVLLTDGVLTFTNSMVNVTKNCNATSYTTELYGSGMLTLGPDSVQAFDDLYVYEDVVVANWGWLESDPTSSYFIYLEDNSRLDNYGSLILNSRVYFNSENTAVFNWGNITSDDDGTDTDACYFYYSYSSSISARPNLTNFENAEINCPVLRIYYITVDNMGQIMVEEFQLSGGKDNAIVRITEDQEDLTVSGDGAIVFVGDRTIQSLHNVYSGGSAIYFSTEGGNVTIANYNSSSRSYWTSDAEGNYFIFTENYYSDYYEYYENAWVIFEDDSNQTSSAIVYFTASHIWTRGHFIIDGTSSWYFNDNSNVTNQGYFEVQTYWYLSQYTTTAGNAQFISVGVLKLWGDLSVTTQFGVCNDGLLVFANGDDDTTFGTSITVSDRFAVDGDIEIEVGNGLADSYTFNDYLIYYSTVASTYADDFEDGIPKTIDHESDYDVEVRDTDSDQSFKDVKTCFTSYALTITYSKDSTCEDQPDFEKGICDQDFPPATVELQNNPGSAASSIIFSVLSVFIIAAFFTLF